MAQFNAGETKSAKTVMRNPTAAAFDYEAYIYMGIDLAVKSQAAFRLNAGEEKQVIFPVTMPNNAGVYPVHLGVFSGGNNLALYRAEDINIAAPPVFSYVSGLRQIVYDSAPGYSWSQKLLRLEIDVKNTGNAAGVCNVWGEYACAQGDWVWSAFNREGMTSAMIQPGQTVTFYHSTLCSAAYGYTCKVRASGDPGTTAEAAMKAY